MKKLFKKEYSILALIILIGGFLRFYNLMWGDGYFFHPDENNMARAISQLSLEDGLNPHFFAYGQFPLYLAYFSFQISHFIFELFRSLPFLHLSNNLITQPPNYPVVSVPFPTAIFFLRFYSALFGVLIILPVYKITKLIIDSKNKSGFALIAALLSALAPGLIQNSHFGTTESLLTFFFMLILYLSLKLIEKRKKAHVGGIVFLGIICGTALAAKLTAVYFLPTAFLAILINLKNQKSRILKYFKHLLLFAVCCLLFAVLFSPYNLISFNEFHGSMNYESSVATGAVKVFYTKQFENTTPILFQLEKIFPYALGLPIFISGSFGFLLMIFKLIMRNLTRLAKQQYQKLKSKKQNHHLQNKIFHFNLSFFIFIFSFLIYLIPNSFLFARWTRFTAPVFPFFIIFASYFLWILFKQEKTASSEAVFGVGKGFYPLPSDTRIPFISQIQRLVKSKLRRGDLHPNPKGSHRVSDGSAASAVHSPLVFIITITLILLSMLFGVSFFRIYTKEDARIQASQWIYKNIPSGSYILSETANVVDIPVPLINNQQSTINNQPLLNYKVISFDFYHLDQEPNLPDELVNHLEKADYIFIPSRRIFANHMRLPEKYPLVNNYYQVLFSGKLGFELEAIITYRGYKGCEECTFQGIENLPDKFNQSRKSNGKFSLSELINLFSVSKDNARATLKSTSEQPYVKDEKGKKIFIPEDLFISDEPAEETWSVFDHPVIRIYKRTKQYDKNYYQTILTAIPI